MNISRLPADIKRSIYDYLRSEDLIHLKMTGRYFNTSVGNLSLYLRCIERGSLSRKILGNEPEIKKFNAYLYRSSSKRAKESFLGQLRKRKHLLAILQQLPLFADEVSLPLLSKRKHLSRNQFLNVSHIKTLEMFPQIKKITFFVPVNLFINYTFYEDRRLKPSSLEMINKAAASFPSLEAMEIPLIELFKMKTFFDPTARLFEVPLTVTTTRTLTFKNLKLFLEGIKIYNVVSFVIHGDAYYSSFLREEAGFEQFKSLVKELRRVPSFTIRHPANDTKELAQKIAYELETSATIQKC